MNNIPLGYKQTEVGVIPEDWEVRPLSNVADIRSGIAKNSNSSVSDPILVHYLRVANVQDGFLDLKEMSKIEVARNDLKRYIVLPGDVLMNEGGDLDKLGRGSIWRGEFNPCVHQNHVFVVRCRSALSPEYLNCWTGTTPARRYFLVAGKQTTNLATINKTALGQLPVALPSLPEQEAIAEALSDTDALIESLEQLIAKKRHLKQGAMQELLTGKRRLPGFAPVGAGLKPALRDDADIGGNADLKRAGLKPAPTGVPHGWEVKWLGEIAHIKTGSRNNQDKIEVGQYPFYVRSATVERINSYSHDCEAILIPGEGGIGNIFHYINGRFDVHQRVYAITQFPQETSGMYVYFYMAKNFGSHAMQNSVKATVDSLRLPTFQNFELVMPSTLEEQTAIATILSDMDAEIAALETKLAKTRSIKQGMMHNLLTGKIRLR